MRAFTLTELLVVIATVAVLAGFVGVAVMRAVDTAKQTRIKTEIDQLHAAFEAYKQKYGSYPPCDLRIDRNATKPTDPYYNAPLRRHIAQTFPKYKPRGTLADDLFNAGVDTYHFRPDQALVFWLSGFNVDSSRPFDSGGSSTAPLFNFDESRLKLFRSPPPPARQPWMPSYFPPGVKFDSSEPQEPPYVSSMPPYVYFAPDGYGVVPDFSVANPSAAQPTSFNTPSVSTLDTPVPVMFNNAGVVVAYWNDANRNGTTNQSNDQAEGWMNPDTFQIIAAGLDGKYGADAITARLYKTGAGYTLADEDNVANFCPRPRLGDDKP